MVMKIDSEFAINKLRIKTLFRAEWHRPMVMPGFARLCCAKGDTLSHTPKLQPRTQQKTPHLPSHIRSLLESLARHHGINVDDPVYTYHNEDFPILP